MRALPKPGLEAKGKSWMPCVGRAAMEGKSEGLLEERRLGSATDRDRGMWGSSGLVSSSSVENETVFLRFLRGGTRTTGDEGRGNEGDGGRLTDAGETSALLSLASPERKQSVRNM